MAESSDDATLEMLWCKMNSKVCIESFGHVTDSCVPKFHPQTVREIHAIDPNHAQLGLPW